MRRTGYILLLTLLLFDFEVCAQNVFQEAVAQGLRFQAQADSMQRLTEALTASLSTAPEARRNGIRMSIRDYDAQATAMQRKANEWFAQAMAIEGALRPALTNDTVQISETMVFEETEKSATISVLPAKTDTPAQQESEFAILDKSPYSAAHPAPIDQLLPDGVVYKIQLGAFSKPVAANTFKGLTPISGETLASGVIRYYAGLFRQFAAANDALRKVREYGFKDAFIVAFYNRKTITPERARQLEGGK